MGPARSAYTLERRTRTQPGTRIVPSSVASLVQRYSHLPLRMSPEAVVEPVPAVTLAPGRPRLRAVLGGALKHGAPLLLQRRLLHRMQRMQHVARKARGALVRTNISRLDSELFRSGPRTG
jgi:hypothetical protein